MTRTEIEKRIADLENKRFFLAMKDMWDNRDFINDDKMFHEIIELKEILNRG